MYPRWSVQCALFAVIAVLLLVESTYGAVGTLSREQQQQLMLDIQDVPLDAPTQESQPYDGLSEGERQLLLLDIDDVPLDDDDWVVPGDTEQPQEQDEGAISEAGVSTPAPTPKPTHSHDPNPTSNKNTKVLPSSTDVAPSKRPEGLPGWGTEADAGAQPIPVGHTVSPAKQFIIATLTMLCGAVVLWGLGLYRRKQLRKTAWSSLQAKLTDAGALKAIPQAQLAHLPNDGLVLHGQAVLIHTELEKSRKLRERTTAWLGCLGTAIQNPELMEVDSLCSFGATRDAVKGMITELERIKEEEPHMCLLQLITTELPLLSGVKKQVHASRMQLSASVMETLKFPVDTAALESLIPLVEATSLDDPKLALFVSRQVNGSSDNIADNLRTILLAQTMKRVHGRASSVRLETHLSIADETRSPRPVSTPAALTAVTSQMGELALTEPLGDVDSMVAAQLDLEEVAVIRGTVSLLPVEQQEEKFQEIITGRFVEHRLARSRDAANRILDRHDDEARSKREAESRKELARQRDEANFQALRAMKFEKRSWQQTQKLKQREEEAQATRANHHMVLLQRLASVSMLGVLGGVVTRLSSTLFTVQSLLAWFEYSCEEQQTPSSWFPLGALSGATSTLGCHARGIAMGVLCGIVLLLVLVFCLKFLSVRGTSIVVSAVLAWSNMDELRRVWAQLLRTCAPALLVVMLVHVVAYAQLRKKDSAVRDQWMLGSVNTFPALVYGLWPAAACFICFELGWFTAGNPGDGLAVSRLWAVLSPAQP